MIRWTKDLLDKIEDSVQLKQDTLNALNERHKKIADRMNIVRIIHPEAPEMFIKAITGVVNLVAVEERIKYADISTHVSDDMVRLFNSLTKSIEEQEVRNRLTSLYENYFRYSLKKAREYLEDKNYSRLLDKLNDISNHYKSLDCKCYSDYVILEKYKENQKELEELITELKNIKEEN